jgi:3',5'-cyclic AMP phosphodiesterase CpdA
MNRIVLLSDLHLSPTHGFFWPNFLLAVDAVNAMNPDAVIVSGDLAINGPDSDEELRFAAEALRRIEAPVHALPGNHDVGDEPPGQDPRQWIDDARLARWDACFGKDRFGLDLDHWRIIGLNSQLPGSGLAREDEQDLWLEAALADRAERRVAVVMHKPLFVETADEDVASAACTVPAARPALMRRFRDGQVEALITGHLHVHRDREVDGLRHLWAPATSFVTDHRLPGAATCGFLTLDFAADGMTATLHRPEGLVDHSLAAIKQNGRYAFLRDMPPCPPDLAHAA